LKCFNLAIDFYTARRQMAIMWFADLVIRI